MRLLSTPIISTEQVCPGTVLLWLEAPEIAAEARPGQYVMARCGNLTLRRPLSIHQRQGSSLALLFAIKGRGTLWLSQLRQGDTVDLLGPLGNGFTVEPKPDRLLLIAGGLGIAPLAFLAQEGVALGHSVTLLYGAATASQLYPPSLLPAGIEVILATEDGSRGRKGMVTDVLPGLISERQQVFACGPVAMYQAIAERFPEIRAQVSLELRLGCGLGACLSCSIQTRQGRKKVCRDGPVFGLEQVIWSEVRV